MSEDLLDYHMVLPPKAVDAPSLTLENVLAKVDDDKDRIEVHGGKEIVVKAKR